MCTGPLICVDEDSASILSSSDSIFMLGPTSSSSSLHHSNSASSSSSFELPNSGRSSCNTALSQACTATVTAATASDPATGVVYQEFQNKFQNKCKIEVIINRFDARGAPSPNSKSSNTSLSKQKTSHLPHSCDTTKQEPTISTYGQICYGELYCYINTFFITNEDRRQERRKLATTALMLPILVFNISHIFFDQCICLFTLLVIRYAAKIFIDEQKYQHNNEEITEESTFCRRGRNQVNSSTDEYSSYGHNSMGGPLPSNASGGLSSCSSSFLTTTQHSLEYDDNSSKDSSLNIQNNHEQHQEYEDEVQLSPANFIPIETCEDANDEWGHFTDFEVDVGQSLQDSSFSSSSTGKSGSSNCNACRSGTIDDPFCSITKSMLRRRGHKLSVCKLEQLQEDDEEEED